MPSCDRFKSHPSQCSGIPLCISPQHLERMGDSGDYKTCHISLTKMQSFIHDIWESAHHLLLLPLPLLLFALFLHSSKVNPRPPYGTQLSDLYSNLFLVTLLVLRGIKRCKLPLDFSFFFFVYKAEFLLYRSMEVMFASETLCTFLTSLFVYPTVTKPKYVLEILISITKCLQS